MEPALFRPPIRRLGTHLVLGAAGGLLVCAAAGIPPLLGALFGAVAAAIALTARHAAGLRVVADERGLRVLEGASQLDGAWGELRVGFGATQREDGAVQRYVAVADGRGRTFAFAAGLLGRRCQPAQGADGRPVEVVELRDAPVLLALLVQRVPAWYALPEPLLAPPPAPAAQVEVAPARPRERRGFWGGLATLGAALLKGAKTANVGWAALSVAAWSLLFTWQFAIALMVQLVVHEYGHVHAMRRTGMKVRGIYFVPLLGAATVGEDSFTSRRQQAYVALSGPLWGAAFTLVPMALWWWTRQPTWAVVATWWAFLNVINLLPIAPLDGGRVMQAFASSFSSGLGLALTLLGLAGAAALAVKVGFSLLWFLLALGIVELLADARSRQGARALRLLPEPARFGPAHWLFLRAASGLAAGRADDVLYLRGLEQQQKAARAEPMRARDLLAWGAAYLCIAVVLVVMIRLMGHVPGADAAAKVLE